MALLNFVPQNPHTQARRFCQAEADGEIKGVSGGSGLLGSRGFHTLTYFFFCFWVQALELSHGYLRVKECWEFQTAAVGRSSCWTSNIRARHSVQSVELRALWARVLSPAPGGHVDNLWAVLFLLVVFKIST